MVERLQKSLMRKGARTPALAVGIGCASTAPYMIAANISVSQIGSAPFAFPHDSAAHKLG